MTKFVLLLCLWRALSLSHPLTHSFSFGLKKENRLRRADSLNCVPTTTDLSIRGLSPFKTVSPTRSRLRWRPLNVVEAAMATMTPILVLGPVEAMGCRLLSLGWSLRAAHDSWLRRRQCGIALRDSSLFASWFWCLPVCVGTICIY